MTNSSTGVKNTAFLVGGMLFAFLLFPCLSLADTAQVLPKGISHVNVKYSHYLDIDKRYDPNGDEEELANDLNATLDSSVIGMLALLDPMTGGSETAILGNSVVDFTLKIRTYEISYWYGLTDKITVGVKIPYFDLENEVAANLDTASSTVGKNIPGNTLAPLFVPGTIPLTTADIQNLLGAGLDINGDGTVTVPGYGFKPVTSWSDHGIGDIELKGRYQLFKNDNWRWAFTGGVRFGTGEPTDPSSLVTIAFGSGQTDLLFKVHADYTGFENLVLHATLSYDLQLPDEELRRVTTSANEPLAPASNLEKVDRDLGNIVGLKLKGTYSFTKTFSAGLQYTVSHRSKHDIDGNLGLNYASLEDETDYTSHVATAMVSYSTVKKYLDKEAKVPYSLVLSYRDRFDGKNNINASRYIGLNFKLYF